MVAPTVEIPYSNKATKEVYVYGGEENSFDIKFKDDSGKIASATVKQGGNKAFADVAGEANTINTQYGFKANVINAETPATEKAIPSGFSPLVAASSLSCDKPSVAAGVPE